MGSLHTIVSAMHLFDRTQLNRSERSCRQCIDLIAKFPPSLHTTTMLQPAEKKSCPSSSSEEDYSHAENFLYMLQGKKPDKLAAHLFDMMLVLHAEHGGGNNSTFTVRAVSSSGANSYMAICSGIASLSGHLHGGANEAVEGMMENIKDQVKDWDDDEEISRYLGKILDKRSATKQERYTHWPRRVYKSDPRAIILEQKAEDIARKAGMEKEFNLHRKVAMLAPGIVLEKKGR